MKNIKRILQAYNTRVGAKFVKALQAAKFAAHSLREEFEKLPDDRYQFQTRIIKIYRWLRWKPWYVLLTTLTIVRWLVTGAKIPTEEKLWFIMREDYIKHLWTMGMALAECKMKHLYTLEEVIGNMEGVDG